MGALLDGKISVDDPVTEIMEGPLPSVPADETVSHVLKIMSEQRNALLVEDGQRIMGILSHFDLIGFASR
ncbi:MAG: CBS domain-containing protein [Candidatus Eisenbacteria bacterium]